MEKRLLYFILAVLVNFSICDDLETVQVKLKQGDISGKEEVTLLKKQKYYSFKGIPFAKPPLGELRFKPPVAHDGWENTYEAHTNKPMCFQVNTRMRMMEPIGMHGSEDCLYISVFSPNIDGSAPVIVFDYNDNFGTSFNGTETYSPEFFMEENIVVVTISHRLEVLGYLTTEDDVIPANNGLRDFIMGLKWIQDNIKQLGGDPNSVTIMGNRGGAIIADILLRSQKAKNLFTGVIMQSGTALENLFFKKNGREKAYKLASILNITADNSETLLKELQKVDVKVLYQNVSDVVTDDDEMLMNMYPFSPLVENDHPDAILTILPGESKIVNDVPVMIGMNSREGLDLASFYIFQPQLIAESSDEFMFSFPLNNQLRFEKKGDIYDGAIKEIQNFYFEEGYFYHGNVLDYAKYVGDMMLSYAINAAAKKLAEKSQSPVYYYMFDFRGLLNENFNYISKYTRFSIKPEGATIADDLCYLHLCSRIKKTYEELLSLVTQQNEIKLLRKMVRLWANFARTRNPTPSEEDDILKKFKWLPINKTSNNTDYLHITKTLNMDINPLGEREKFWDDFLEKYSKLAKDGIIPDEKTQKQETQNEETKNEEKEIQDEEEMGEKVQGEETQGEKLRNEDIQDEEVQDDETHDEDIQVLETQNEKMQDEL